MDVYPEKMDGTPHHARSSAWCGVPTIFSGYTSIHRKILLFNITFHLIFNAIKTPKWQFDVNVANGIAIDVANDALPVWWMEYTLFVLTNQNHCYMPKFNDFSIHCFIKFEIKHTEIVFMFTKRANTSSFLFYRNSIFFPIKI